MTTPDHIFVTPAWARTFDEKTDPVEREYVRRDPAVLAELPEVREAFAKGLEAALEMLTTMKASEGVLHQPTLNLAATALRTSITKARAAAIREGRE